MLASMGSTKLFVKIHTWESYGTKKRPNSMYLQTRSWSVLKCGSFLIELFKIKKRKLQNSIQTDQNR